MTSEHALHSLLTRSYLTFLLAPVNTSSSEIVSNDQSVP